MLFILIFLNKEKYPFYMSLTDKDIIKGLENTTNYFNLLNTMSLKSINLTNTCNLKSFFLVLPSYLKERRVEDFLEEEQKGLLKGIDLNQLKEDNLLIPNAQETISYFIKILKEKEPLGKVYGDDNLSNLGGELEPLTLYDLNGIKYFSSKDNVFVRGK